ncbi:MAG: hypothetical protein ACI9F9_001678 [Candidatus Paceibacteria bacterium]
MQPLLEQFVLAADEVWRLQNNPGPECLFFRRAVVGVEAPYRGTLQGTYVFAASGKLLGRLNSSNPEAVASMLEIALKEWTSLPETELHLENPTDVAPGFRWEQSYPEDGLVLRRTGRDLPVVRDPAQVRAGRFNRDAVWFSAAEARSIFGQTPEQGQRQRLSADVVKRLSCLALVDNVRGQTVPYHPSEDAGSEIWSEVIGVDGDSIELRLTGHTRARAEGPWLFESGSLWEPKEGRRWPHAISTTLLGSAIYSTKLGRFTHFELLALGEREGRTINNGRRQDGEQGIGFVCELAPADWRVAPTFIDAYEAAWVTKPGD